MAGSAGDRQEVDSVERGAASIVREEARRVLEGQLRILRETDRKAMAIARVVAVILGLLLSAASLSDAPTDALNRWLVVGSSLLLSSFLVAVITYSVDRPSYGIGSGYIDDLPDTLADSSRIERELLDEYADWISDNNEEIGPNSTYLLVS